MFFDIMGGMYSAGVLLLGEIVDILLVWFVDTREDLFTD